MAVDRGVFSAARLPRRAMEQLGGYEVFEVEADDAALARCTVLMAWPSRVGAGLYARMPRLEAIQSLSAGVDAFDFHAIPPEVKVYSNAGAYSVPVAEHAWGLLLGAAKGLHVRKERVAPRMVGGGTILVVGCGGIGSEIARLAKGMGMNTVGASRSFKVPSAFDRRVSMDELPAVVGGADAIAIALPLTTSTASIVDYKLLALAKPVVTVVNVGRGETVSEEGLIRWLRERPESRYTTDVFWKKDGRETFETDAWSLSNFSGTLHNSGAPAGADTEYALIQAAANVRRYLESGDASNRVQLDEYIGPSQSKSVGG